MPLFTAAGFDAERVADLVAASGARYLVPFSKHHDGFCLWDSSYTERDVVDLRPGFDVTGALVDACRRRGLRSGFYFSVEEYEYPVVLADGSIAVRLWEEEMAHGASLRKVDGQVLTDLAPLHERRLSGKVPVPRFVEDYLVPQAKEFIDRYQPDILWYDGEWGRSSDYYRTRDLAAYFYNRAEGQRQVVVNDRFGKESRRAFGDFFTSETDEITQPIDRTWEENRSMSGSYGYSRTDDEADTLSATELVHMLVRIVARGGNLNLVVSPDGTGTVPEAQRSRLQEIGRVARDERRGHLRDAALRGPRRGQPARRARLVHAQQGRPLRLRHPPRLPPTTRPSSSRRPTRGTARPSPCSVTTRPSSGSTPGRRPTGCRSACRRAWRDDPSKRPGRHAWVIRFEWDRKDEF